MIDLPAFTALLEAYSTHERLLIEVHNPQGDGAFEQRERIQAAARYVCEHAAGDLVEIGCLNGSTTILLAQVAREFGRRVLAIDPFTPGTQNVEPETFGIFSRTIEPYADVIDFLRLRSDDPQAVAEMKRREIAVAFVDGLHIYSVCLLDILAVGHAAVIAVDDTRGIEEVRAAFHDAVDMITQTKKEARTKLMYANFRESWIVKGAAAPSGVKVISPNVEVARIEGTPWTVSVEYWTQRAGR